jgi:hypothetical protein
MAKPGTSVAAGFQHGGRTVANLNVSLVDDQPEHHTDRISHNVALAAIDLFPCIVPTSPSTFCGFHALAVYHSRRWAGFTPLQFPHIHRQIEPDRLPQSAVAPIVKIPLNCRIWREVLRNLRPPLENSANALPGNDWQPVVAMSRTAFITSRKFVVRGLPIRFADGM